MAQKTVTSLIDDLTGEPADETVRFGLDGAQYEIDLSAAGATRLREALAPFTTAARRAGNRQAQAQAKPRSRSGNGKANPESTAIRTWARANGWPGLSDRGRISDEIVTAYRNALTAA